MSNPNNPYPPHTQHTPEVPSDASDKTGTAEADAIGHPALDRLVDFMEDVDRKLAKNIPCDLTPLTQLMAPACDAILKWAETQPEEAAALMHNIDHWLEETEALLRQLNTPPENGSL